MTLQVAPPDTTGWLIQYTRSTMRACGFDVEVGEAEPTEFRLPLTRPLLVVRTDSQTRSDWTTFDYTCGANVIGGTKDNPGNVDEIARVWASILFDANLPLVEGSPIVSVEFGGQNGPYPVADPMDVSRRYLTAQYTVAGSW